MNKKITKLIQAKFDSLFDSLTDIIRRKEVEVIQIKGTIEYLKADRKEFIKKCEKAGYDTKQMIEARD